MRRAVAAGVGTVLALVAVAALVIQPALGSHARPKMAKVIRAALVPAFAACSAPNRTHGPPLAFPSCSPPVQVSSRLTVGVAPAQPTNFVGSWTIEAVHGIPGPPEDSGARIYPSLVDVRCGISTAGCPTPGADYTGELEVRVTMRLSDHYNRINESIAYQDPATVPDLELSMPLPCAATADPNTGAVCDQHSDLLYHYPGLPKDGKRMILELGSVRVFDGGDDGDASTDDGAQPFLTQGVFVP